MLNFCLDLKDKEQIMLNNIETEHKNIFVIGGYLSYKFHSSVFPMLRFPCMVFVNKSVALKYVPFIRTMTMTRWSICSNSLSHHRAIDVFARETNIHDTKHYLTILLFFVCLKLGLLIFLLKVKIASYSFHWG